MKTSDVLWSSKSPYQKIELVRDGKGMLFTLNGWPQVHSLEEGLYHENVATVPMMLARRVARCLVLGGGDGLAARNMLRFRGVKELTLVELDPGVVEMCCVQPDFAALNGGVFMDPRLKLVVGDAIEWLLREPGPFDVIVNDIETAFTDQPRALTLETHFKLFQAMAEKLDPRGVAVVTVPDDFDGEVLEGFFEAFGDRLPPASRRAFQKDKHPFARAEILLGTLFPYVRRWAVRFPRLGAHASFYLSHRPLTVPRRSPVPAPLYTGRFFRPSRRKPGK